MGRSRMPLSDGMLTLSPMSKQTPLTGRHRDLGARLIDFGGFEMPVQYQGIRAEHHAVRQSAGIFDVSHMGEFLVTGPHALDLIQRLTVNDALTLSPGKAQYTAMCHEHGGIVDDLIVYCLGPERYLMVVNAANIEKDWDWVVAHNDEGATVENLSDAYALIALQGPASAGMLAPLTNLAGADAAGSASSPAIPAPDAGAALSALKSYTFTMGSVAGQNDVIISATGYTGEPGFELYIDTRKADPAAIWDALLAAGATPAGLGARDTLRLEMGYALYGQDISADTTPLEGRLGWLTKLEGQDFIGKDAILAQKQSGIPRRLCGFVILESRQLPRHGYAVEAADGTPIGVVTSGGQSITLEKGIGMALLDSTWAKEGTEIRIVIREQRIPATITAPPFIGKG